MRRRLPLLLLAALHVAALFAELIAPHSPLEHHRDMSWAPPSHIRLVDAEGRFHLRPFIYPRTPDPVELDRYHEDTSRPLPLRFFVRGEPYELLGLWESDLHLLGVDPPGHLFLLGTDEFGRDVFARTLAGARISLFAGLLAATLSLGLGTLVGTVAGYVGGGTDRTLMRFVELFMALPWLYLLLGVRAFLPLSVSPTHTFLLIVALIGLIGWARPARLVRGVVLSARERAFVTASYAGGNTHPGVLGRHILPQVAGLVGTQTAVLIPRFVLAEVALSFLGLGLPLDIPTWGNLLANLQRTAVLNNYVWMIAPALALVFVVILYLPVAHRAGLGQHERQGA